MAQQQRPAARLSFSTRHHAWPAGAACVFSAGAQGICRITCPNSVSGAAHPRQLTSPPLLAEEDVSAWSVTPLLLARSSSACTRPLLLAASCSMQAAPSQSLAALDRLLLVGQGCSSVYRRQAAVVWPRCCRLQGWASSTSMTVAPSSWPQEQSTSITAWLASTCTIVLISRQSQRLAIRHLAGGLTHAVVHGVTPTSACFWMRAWD